MKVKKQIFERNKYMSFSILFCIAEIILPIFFFRLYHNMTTDRDPDVKVCMHKRLSRHYSSISGNWNAFGAMAMVHGNLHHLACTDDHLLFNSEWHGVYIPHCHVHNVDTLHIRQCIFLAGGSLLLQWAMWDHKTRRHCCG